MFKYIKGPQRQLKIEGICVRYRKVPNTVSNEWCRRLCGRGICAIDMGHEPMGAQSMNRLSIMAIILLTVLTVYL